jgi:hypothetical protein
MADTGCSKPTVIAARRWLVKHGWIRVLEGSAADMYEKPTQGARKVRIMCVDDPTNGVGGKETLPGEGVKKVDVKELGKETLPNVSAVAFASALAVAVASGIEATPTLATTCRKSSPSEEPSLREDEKQKPNQPQEQKQQQQLVRVSSTDKWLAKYDASKPAWFDEAAYTVEGQLKRSAWIKEHAKIPPVEPTPKAPPVSEPEIPALPPVVELAPPMSPTPSCEHDEPVKGTVMASVLSATPTPPDSASPSATTPAKRVEEDWRKLGIERLVNDFHTLQLHYNPKQPPPADWQTLWFAEWEKLYAMTEGRDAVIRHWMLIDLLAASQVNHATVSSSPAMILDADLAEEIIRLRTEDKFDEVWDAHWEVVCPVKHEEDEDLLDDLDPVDAERKERERLKENTIGLNRWKKWLEENPTSCESPAAA